MVAAELFKARVQLLGQHLFQAGRKLAVAESCTGGELAALLTSVPGSSTWFERGWVTYSNQAKTDLLGVSAQLIEQAGAVSETVACAMAEGALQAAPVDLAVAITGIAGPDGGRPGKPVGTVWIAVTHRAGTTRARCHVFAGDRAAVRGQSVVAALDALLEYQKQLI